MPRPSKLTIQFLEILTAVLNENHNALICTDEELLLLVNEKLPPRRRVSARSFSRYKSKALQNNEQRLDKLFTAFTHAIMLCRIKEKQNLYGRVIDESRNWTKWKWVLERKYGDWNDNNRDKKDIQPIMLSVYPHNQKNDS